MRRLKADVSHRIRPRGPSVFRAGWFRLVLAGGAAVILGLTLGPSVAVWLGGSDLPHGAGVVVAPSSGPGSAPAQALEGSEPAGVLAGSAAQPGPPAVRETRSPGTSVASTLTNPASVFRIQVGAFLDHRNADHLVERLRNEGLGASTSVFEQSRMLYRVLVLPPEEAPGGSLPGRIELPEGLLAQLRALGFSPELTDEGASVTGQVSLHEAVEVSHRLREQGIRVRLKQEVDSATYRVVRVGSYETSEEADRALASLVMLGFDGFVVRER